MCVQPLKVSLCLSLALSLSLSRALPDLNPAETPRSLNFTQARGGLPEGVGLRPRQATGGRGETRDFWGFKIDGGH